MMMKKTFTLILVAAIFLCKPFYSQAQVANENDSLALVDLYNSTDGANWYDNTNWLKGTVKSWAGISLSGDGRVVTIDLGANQLKGTIPTSIGNLTSLQSLVMEHNIYLTGSIPVSIGNLVNLKSLWLDNSQLSGLIPPSIGNLVNLQNLYLNDNQLSDTIPSSLGNLIALQNLWLSDNQLYGSIPKSLGNLVNLQYLYLQANLLSGAIPSELSNLNITCHIWLYGNYFTFDGMEAFTKKGDMQRVNEIYAPQYNIPLHANGNLLYVSAGGTLSKNTYRWYKSDTLIATVSADSTFKPAITGNYWVAVTNSIATELTLYSDTMAITNAELPITYVSFTAQPTHNGNLLQWQTATEINSAYFNVQRSTDGVRFVTIAQVNAAGNSSTVQSYQYTDALTGLNPVPPALFYRLQEADKDGDVTYSKIIQLDNSNIPQVTLSIFPNPVHEVLNVQLQGMTGTATILVTDASGKTLQARQVNAVVGQTISINTQALVADVYFVQVLHGKESITQKFVKE